MLIDQAAALAAHARMQPGAVHLKLSAGDVDEESRAALPIEVQRLLARREREALRRARLKARTDEWIERHAGTGVLPPLGARVVVTDGKHAGVRGVRGRKAGIQVRVLLPDGRVIRPLCVKVRLDTEAA